MLEKIEDIEHALEAKTYLAALALALTLPDICGKIAYPHIKGNGERYIKWFDEYLTQYDYPPDFDERLKFDGKKCWKLRCAFLHEGSIGQLPGIDKFELSITHPSNGVYGASTYGRTWANDDVENADYHIRIDVAQLCFQLLSCVKGFYNSYENKSVFVDQSISITDINEEVKKIREPNKY